MHLFVGDPLRDAIWQFIAFTVSTVLSIVGLVLPNLLSKKEDSGRQRAYITLMQPDTPLGCGGTFTFLLMQGAAGYLLYELLVHLFLLGRSVDPVTLAWASFASVFICMVGMASLRHSGLAFRLTIHFCALTFLFLLVIVSLKMGVLIDKDLTFVPQFVAQYIPEVKGIPLSLHAVPTDVRMYDPSGAKTLFIWGYGLSLAVVFFLYANSKRSLSQRASAWAYLDERSKRNILEDLDRQDKEQTVKLKEQAVHEKNLDLQHKQITSTITLANLLADALHPETESAARGDFVRKVLPDLLQPDGKATGEIITAHLQHMGASIQQQSPPSPIAQNASPSLVVPQQGKQSSGMQQTPTPKRIKRSSSPSAHTGRHTSTTSLSSWAKGQPHASLPQTEPTLPALPEVPPVFLPAETDPNTFPNIQSLPAED